MVALLLTVYVTESQARVAGNTPIPDDSDCYRCHENFTHDTFETLAGEVCVKCHKGAAVQEMAIKTVTEKKSPTKSIASDAGIPGMVVPMYYDKTRLGDVPNDMVRIPGGVFTIGTNNRMPDEGPEHKLNLPTFWIDKYEVTNLQYKRFIDATRHRSPGHFRNRTYPAGKVDHPVTFVNWNDAQAYCQWAGKRLPTNEEWEKAARGTDVRTYPWGNEFVYNKANNSMLWKTINRDGDTTPAGAFPGGASPYGVHDMSGNVWEWTASLYRQYPGNKSPAETYSLNYRTLKGGSWWDCSFYQCGLSAPVYNRSFFSAQMKNETFGFRCAKDGQ